MDADFAGGWDKADADSAENVMSRTGYNMMYGECPINWKSTLQSEICLSTAESEYVALSQALREVLPTMTFLEEIAKIVAIINQTTTNFKSIKNIDKILSKRYHQKLEDIQEWLSITDWNCGELIEKEFISSIQNKLLQYNVINKKKNPEDFI